MPRANRPTAAGIYHVSTRAQRDDELFRDEADFLRFESELRLLVERAIWRCIAACALTTHYHLLLELAENLLSRSMARLNKRYAGAYNARYRRRGHAFAGRYLSVMVETDEQLLSTYRYIARNPVEGGICRRPQDWRWSSYTTLIGEGDRFAFADASLAVEVGDGLEAAAAVRRERSVSRKAVSGRLRRSQTPRWAPSLAGGIVHLAHCGGGRSQEGLPPCSASCSSQAASCRLPRCSSRSSPPPGFATAGVLLRRPGRRRRPPAATYREREKTPSVSRPGRREGPGTFATLGRRAGRRSSAGQSAALIMQRSVVRAHPALLGTAFTSR
jgi:putative transposase